MENIEDVEKLSYKDFELLEYLCHPTIIKYFINTNNFFLVHLINKSLIFKYIFIFYRI